MVFCVHNHLHHVMYHFERKQINLAIANISGVKTHNPIGGYYWVMFAQHTQPE